MSTSFSVKLPYPDAALNPNAGSFWATRGKAAKASRGMAKMLTIDALNRLKGFERAEIESAGRYSLFIGVCYPKLLRTRDVQNVFIALKPHIDGIADAIGKNDSTFKAWHVYELTDVAEADPRGDIVIMVTPFDSAPEKGPIA